MVERVKSVPSAQFGRKKRSVGIGREEVKVSSGELSIEISAEETLHVTSGIVGHPGDQETLLFDHEYHIE